MNDLLGGLLGGMFSGGMGGYGMDQMGIMNALGGGPLGMSALGIAPAMQLGGGSPLGMAAMGMAPALAGAMPMMGMGGSMAPLSPMGALMGGTYGYGQGAVGMLNQFLQSQFDDKMKTDKEAIIDLLLNERAAKRRPETLKDILGGAPYM